MNKLVDAFVPIEHTAPNVTLTENEALAYASTKNKTLDFYATSGALRGRPSEFTHKFIEAWNDDSLLSLKALFHARDIRGGNGERENFRAALSILAKQHPVIVAKNLQLISEFGRWDDLWGLLDNPRIRYAVVDLVRDQLYMDMSRHYRNQSISLLAKWMPSNNTSSSKTRNYASILQEALELSPKNYRKILSSLRNHLRIVEREMSNREYSMIDYEKVPSQASKRYRKTFFKRDQERYQAFLASVKKGEKKIKAATLNPDQLVKHYLNDYGYCGGEDETLEALWAALPNYMDGRSMIVVADTSGSMRGEPMQVSIALAIYAAERNTGPFHNCWISFSERPTWQVLKGDSLHDKVYHMVRKDVSNTNLEAVFKMILKVATDNNVPASDMPKVIVIISDMQFDKGSGGFNFTTHETINALYRRVGYEMPVIVYWNVRSSSGQPVKRDDRGTVLVSGYSTGAFKALMACDPDKLREITPLQFMLEVLNGDRYSKVTV